MAAVPFNNAGYASVVRAISSGGDNDTVNVTSNGSNLATEATLANLYNFFASPPTSPAPVWTVAPSSSSVWAVTLPTYTMGTQTVSNSQSVNPAANSTWAVTLPSNILGTQLVSNSQSVNPAANSTWAVTLPSNILGTQLVSNSQSVNPANGTSWAVTLPSNILGTQTVSNSQSVNPASNSVWSVALASTNLGTQPVTASLAVNPASNSTWAVTFPSYTFGTQTVSNAQSVAPAVGTSWAVALPPANLGTQLASAALSVTPAFNSAWAMTLPPGNLGTQVVTASLAVNPAFNSTWAVTLPSHVFGTQTVSNSQSVSPASNTVWAVTFPSYVFGTQAVSNSQSVNPASNTSWAVTLPSANLGTQSVPASLSVNPAASSVWSVTSNGENLATQATASSIATNTSSTATNTSNTATNTASLAALIASGGLNVNILGTGGICTEATLAFLPSNNHLGVSRILVNFEQTSVTTSSFILGTEHDITTYPRAMEGFPFAPQFVLGSTNTDAAGIRILYRGWDGSYDLQGTATIANGQTTATGSLPVYWINHAVIDYEDGTIGQSGGLAIPLDNITVNYLVDSVTPTFAVNHVISPTVNNSPAFMAIQSGGTVLFIESITVTASESCVIRVCVSPGFASADALPQHPAQKAVLMSFSCEANVTYNFPNIWRKCDHGALFVQCDTDQPSIDVRGSVQYCKKIN